jgi:O-antigen ligase
LIVVVAYLVNARPRLRSRGLLYLPLLGLGLYAVFLLSSRGVAAALIAGIGAVAYKHLRESRLMLGLLLAVTLVGLVVFQLPGSRGMIQRFSERDVSTLNDRIPLWVGGLQYLLKSSPLVPLIGGGMGTSEKVVNRINPALASIHNAYLQILVDFGLFGLFLFLGLVTATVRNASRSLGYVGDASLGITVYMLVFCLTATVTDNYVFWACLAVAFFPGGRLNGA